MTTEPVVYDVNQWIAEHQQYFLPPVANYMMHKDGHLKVFFVGGPNIREDYHIEEGEEFFFQRKGDMVLKVVERDHFRDIRIKENQIFLLPGRIPHSPQRYKDTVGLVIERERVPQKEYDCLRYYVGEGKNEVLFERWFYCSDLGTQLPPVINAFMASEQRKTRTPGPGSTLCPPKYQVDNRRKLVDPIDIDIILKNPALNRAGGRVDIFGDEYRSEILMLGEGAHGPFESGEGGETFLWQFVGAAVVDVDGTKRSLAVDETLLARRCSVTWVTNKPQGRTLVVRMNNNNNNSAS